MPLNFSKLRETAGVTTPPFEYIKAYGELLADLRHKAGREYEARCPFHDDSNPSLHVNEDSGLFHCKGCGAGGNLVSFVARLKGIPVARAARLYPQLLAPENVIHPQLVEGYHSMLLSNAKVLGYVVGQRGIPEEWVRLARLGLHEDRLTIPVYNAEWWVIDVKYHAIDPKCAGPKDKHAVSYGGTYLFPAQLPVDPLAPAVVAEGELDCLVLRARGFQSYTTTGGAMGTARSEELAAAVARHPAAYVCMDIDQTGRKAALELGERLSRAGVKNVLVNLPLDAKAYEHGDVTDYFVKEGYTPQDFSNLLRAAEVEAGRAGGGAPGGDATEVYDVAVGQASRAQYWGQRVRFLAMVVAKGVHPYFVPVKATVVCSQGYKVCAECLVPGGAGIELKCTDERLAEFVGASKGHTQLLLKQVKGVPVNCRYCSVSVDEVINVQEMVVTGTFQSIVSLDEVDVTRRCLFLGHDVSSNNVYKMQADIVADPRTNEVLYVVVGMEPAVDDITNYEVSEADKEAIAAFVPDTDDAAGVRRKLDEIYEDLSANVTRIYGRKNLHQLIDLGYHSVLAFAWEDQPDKLYKGLTEVLVIGDSAQGKSEVIESLRAHYGRGEKLDCKSLSYAGLIGGLEDIGQRKFMVWGRIPQNDRGAVILDEVKGMAPELIAQLTDVRSSGMAVVTRVGGARRAGARVRYFWLSNPRNKLRISEYGYGVTAVPDLLGSNEDVRRLDAAMVVATGEVPQSYIDSMVKNPPKVEHKYTEEKCRRLIRVVWSRAKNTVPTGVRDYAVDAASRLSSSYAVDIPLLEPADARLKVARLALSVAARVGSFTPDFSSVLVKACHVDVAVGFLHDLYDAEHFAFDKWSSEHRKTAVATGADDAAVLAELVTLAAPQDFVAVLMVSNFIPHSAFEMATGLEPLDARRLAGTLVSKQYMVPVRSAYRKTPKFITLLKRIQEDPRVLEAAKNKEGF